MKILNANYFKKFTARIEDKIIILILKIIKLKLKFI